MLSFLSPISANSTALLPFCVPRSSLPHARHVTLRTPLDPHARLRRLPSEYGPLCTVDEPSILRWRRLRRAQQQRAAEITRTFPRLGAAQKHIDAIAAPLSPRMIRVQIVRSICLETSTGDCRMGCLVVPPKMAWAGTAAPFFEAAKAS